MALNEFQRFNIHEIENFMRKGNKKFIRFLDEVYELKGFKYLLTTIKSSGLYLNLYNNDKNNQLIKEVTEHLRKRLNNQEFEQINILIDEANKLYKLVVRFNEKKEEYFNRFAELSTNNMVSSYVLSLERFLSSLHSEQFDSGIWRTKVGLFDSAVESTGMILKSFMYNNIDFCRHNNIISESLLDISNKHIDFSIYWVEIDNIINLWKYSSVKIDEYSELEIFKVNIEDKEFQLNNIVSNARYINLKDSWEFSILGELVPKYKLNDIKVKEELLKEQKNKITYLVSCLLFGTVTLEETVDNVKLHRWLSAYQLLVEECRKFLKKRNEEKYSLKEYCLSKTKKQWKEFFTRHGFNKSEFSVIFEGFIFSKNSQDITDTPFIKFDDLFVVVPSLLVNSDIPRALASNFLNRKLELSFRGTGFEERTKAGLKMRNIETGTLYKRDNETEYQCDVVFKIGSDVFFVECKSHVQPYTTRQHANHLYKLYEETSQINRIADYFVEHLDYVKDQLKMNDNEQILNTHRLIITTSMLGAPLYINGVYIVDESSFNTFISRSKPSLKLLNKDKFSEINSNKYEIYNGEITTGKILEFLRNPPQVEIMGEFVSEQTIELGNIILTRLFQVQSTMHIGQEIDKFTADLADRHYVNSTELNELYNNEN